MSSITIPLAIRKGRLARTESPKTAIDAALELLMTTACYSSAADPEYGFIFNNLRFEIFNENEGVVYNSSGPGSVSALRAEFEQEIEPFADAAELKQIIDIYEPRLRDVAVSMTYIREERKIYITVKGVIAENDKPYQYSSIINVWK